MATSQRTPLAEFSPEPATLAAMPATNSPPLPKSVSILAIASPPAHSSTSATPSCTGTTFCRPPTTSTRASAPAAPPASPTPPSFSATAISGYRASTWASPKSFRPGQTNSGSVLRSRRTEGPRCQVFLGSQVLRFFVFFLAATAVDRQGVENNHGAGGQKAP